MRLIFFLILFFATFIAACQSNDALETNHEGAYMKLSTRPEYNQDVANNVKMRLSKRDELSVFHVVNDDKNILIAFDVDHIHRFSLGKIEHEIKQEISDLFQDYKVTVSTDLKIILGLEDLEKKIHEGTISQKKISKEIRLLIKLTEDEA